MMNAEKIALQGGASLWLAELPEHLKGIVIICPGGAYRWLSPREAEPVANAFRQGGWGAAVLEYTIRETPHQPPVGRLPMQQLGQAVEMMRQRFPQRRVIVCGFSAGGHLAASLGAHWHQCDLPRPDALVLGYPVITAGRYANRESFANLAVPEEQGWYSLEKQITAQMPPVFFWHTVTDPEVPVQNSLLLAQALSDANVRYEMHLYPNGVHGLSLATPEVEETVKNRFADPHIAGWFQLCLEWLETLHESKE